MADLTNLAQEAAALIDKLEEEMEDGDEVGTVMLLAEVKIPATDDHPEGTYLRYRCSDPRFVVQSGMVAWANSAMHAGSYTSSDAADDDDA